MTTEWGQPDGDATPLPDSTPQADQPAPRPAWRAPTITCIDIKRTMAKKGSYFDGVAFGPEP
jgi:hypothetical protein